jgi:DNA gyrase/topoisomerase IV subunit A
MNQVALESARGELATLNATAKTVRKQIKDLESLVREERFLSKLLQQELAQKRKEKAEDRKAAQVAALQAKLAALQSPKALKSAARKPSPVTLIPKESVAA